MKKGRVVGEEKFAKPLVVKGMFAYNFYFLFSKIKRIRKTYRI